MAIPELVTRIQEWLASGYCASIFEDDFGILAYALYREKEDHVYLRQFFVKYYQRRNGVGRQCIKFYALKFGRRTNELLSASFAITKPVSLSGEP